MTSAPSRPNFFSLLGLNPDDEWNQEQFEKTLQEHINQWNRDSLGVAKKALQAKKNRSFIPQIRAVMRDSELRSKEITEARKEQAAQIENRRTQFEKQLAFINIKDIVDQEEVDRFIADFQDILTKEEIETRLTVIIRKESSPILTVPATLDDSIIHNIQYRLQVLDMNNLYELLQRPKQTSTTELFLASQNLYKEMVRQRPTVEVTAKIELAGLAMDVFKTEGTRARYDETQRQSSLLQILSDLDESMKRTIHKEVHPNQVRLYLDNAHQQGWNYDEALQRLKDYARQHKWELILPAEYADNALTMTEQGNNTPTISSGNNPPIASSHEIQDLEYQKTNRSLRLRWTWPPDCQAVYLTYSTRFAPPQHYTNIATTLFISQAEYDHLGYYDIEGQQNVTYHILLSAIIQRSEDQEEVTPGCRLSVQLQTTTLVYELKPQNMFRSHRTLHIIANATTQIPTLLLVYKTRDIPFRRSDGEVLCRINILVEEQDLSIILPSTKLAPGTFGKLFLEDESLYSEYIIHHPDKQHLRLT